MRCSVSGRTATHESVPAHCLIWNRVAYWLVPVPLHRILVLLTYLPSKWNFKTVPGMRFDDKRTTVCRYDWHSAGSLGWPYPMLRYNFFSNKIHVSNCVRNFIKQHSETVMVWNYQYADCSLKNKFVVLFIIIFGTFSFAVVRQWSRPRSDKDRWN